MGGRFLASLSNLQVSRVSSLFSCDATLKQKRRYTHPCGVMFQYRTLKERNAFSSLHKISLFPLSCSAALSSKKTQWGKHHLLECGSIWIPLAWCWHWLQIVAHGGLPWVWTELRGRLCRTASSVCVCRHQTIYVLVSDSVSPHACKWRNCLVVQHVRLQGKTGM